MQVQQRLLKEKELKIRKALERLRKKRHLLGRQRRRREFPVISMVGYTNCGESSSGGEAWGPPLLPHPALHWGEAACAAMGPWCRGPADDENRWKAWLTPPGHVGSHGSRPIRSLVWLSSAGQCRAPLSYRCF